MKWCYPLQTELQEADIIQDCDLPALPSLCEDIHADDFFLHVHQGRQQLCESLEGAA